MNSTSIKKLNIPVSSGCYQFLNNQGGVIYIGKAANLKNRIFSYWRKNANHSGAKLAMLKQIAKIKWVETESEIEALLLEANLIKKYQPYYNVLLRDDKRFVYIKISLEDEIPGVFVTRKIDKSGRYFGPFVSAQAARETVKALRKIWPFCATRKSQPRPCFYYQINLCAGICADLISKDDYLKKVIKPIILFLEGKKGSIIKNYELRLRNYGKEIKKVNGKSGKFLEITRKKENLQYQLANMKKVLESANILSLGEKYENDVVELAKVLGLEKIPERIEGYDISNTFGRESVGSMVVFSSGEPVKSEYRKFKIKVGEGRANDIGMLKEILERRFKRASLSYCQDSKDNNWPLPDLIIVDGGKAQLNTALRAIKKYKLIIPIIAIAKGSGLRSSIAPDKLFFPGEKKPLELSLSSPALHLIKRVRDEAHRFAISYHRLLRKKKLLI
jgi:excinuclease ABC subunit C